MKRELEQKIIERFLEIYEDNCCGYFDVFYVNKHGETIGGGIYYDYDYKEYRVNDCSSTLNKREVNEEDIQELLDRESRYCAGKYMFEFEKASREEIYMKHIYFDESLGYTKINSMYAYLKNLNRFFKLGNSLFGSYLLDKKYNRAIWYFKRRGRCFYWEDDALEEYEKIKNISQEQNIY